jgi:hypothetical protein
MKEKCDLPSLDGRGRGRVKIKVPITATIYERRDQKGQLFIHPGL